MFIPAVAAFFKYKIVSSIIILACGNEFEQMRLVRELSVHGMRSTVTCDPSLLDQETNRLRGILYFVRANNTLLEESKMRLVRELSVHGMRSIITCDPSLLDQETNRRHGILYFVRANDTLLEEAKLQHFSIWNKWLIIGERIPDRIHRVRYDADIALLDHRPNTGVDVMNTSVSYPEWLFFEDVYVHLRDGATRHPWAVWSAAGFQAWGELTRIRRRLDLQGYPIRLATPVGFYDESYKGTFAEYVHDNSEPERDSATRCGYGSSALLIQRLRAKYSRHQKALFIREVLTQVEQWGTEVGNRSMFTRLADGTSELSGGILRIYITRLAKLDYVIPLWPFTVGFTYVAERESSNNMFVMPFTGATWIACVVITLILVIAQRVTAKAPSEKDGAYMAVLATWLQQDAGAVPDGASGRVTFMVLSVYAMLVYAYYSSAIVSALMSAESGGPITLQALADSRYAIASEDYDWIRYHMFDIYKADWPEMEYLKRKKLQTTTNFYMNKHVGMRLVKQGNLAYHAEYNHVYPLMKILTDSEVCKLQYVHTVGPVMTWLTTTKRGQWTEVLRVAGLWLLETGLAQQMVSRWQVKPPPCRAALLAERVSYGDVAPMIYLTAMGFVASVALLVLERAMFKFRTKKTKSMESDDTREQQMID